MNLIVAVDKNWGIGCDGELLFSIPQDMKFFRSVTAKKVVVMGRATLESLPQGKPLKNRVNIILSTNSGFKVDGAVVCHNLDELFVAISVFKTEDVFVIGGQSVYNMLLDYCKSAFVTKVFSSVHADRVLRNIDNEKGWEVVQKSDDNEHEGTRFSFVVYENKNAKEYKVSDNAISSEEFLLSHNICELSSLI